MIRDRDSIFNELQAHLPELRQYGVRRLGLFGSVARGEATNQSDLDFLVEFDHPTFDAYMDLKAFLESCFQCKVDLVIEDTLKPRIRDRILEETVYASGL